MEKKERKVVHIYFKEKGLNDYFGSITAIYDYYGKEDIGIALRTLQSQKIDEDTIYENKKVIIRIAFIKTKRKTNKNGV